MSPKQTNILLISQDQQIQKSIKALLSNFNGELDVKDHIDESDIALDDSDNNWNLIFVHTEAQKKEALQVCNRFKSRKPLLPVIAVSKDPRPEVAAECLANGADDFIGYPWNNTECIARTSVAIKRNKEITRLLNGNSAADTDLEASSTLSETPDSAIKTIGDVEVCQVNRKIKVAGQLLQTTQTEYTLLSYLIDNIDRPCSSVELLNDVIGYRDKNYLPSLHSHICRLRRKLKDSKTTYIQTVWCYGYRVGLYNS